MDDKAALREFALQRHKAANLDRLIAIDRLALVPCAECLDWLPLDMLAEKDRIYLCPECNWRLSDAAGSPEN